MKTFQAMCAVLAGGLLSACGGGGDESGPVTAEPPTANTSDAWDSWNWDEGGFGE